MSDEGKQLPAWYRDQLLQSLWQEEWLEMEKQINADLGLQEGEDDEPCSCLC